MSLDVLFCLNYRGLRLDNVKQTEQWNIPSPARQYMSRTARIAGSKTDAVRDTSLTRSHRNVILQLGGDTGMRTE